MWCGTPSHAPPARSTQRWRPIIIACWNTTRQAVLRFTGGNLLTANTIVKYNDGGGVQRLQVGTTRRMRFSLSRREGFDDHGQLRARACTRPDAVPMGNASLAVAYRSPATTRSVVRRTVDTRHIPLGHRRQPVAIFVLA